MQNTTFYNYNMHNQIQFPQSIQSSSSEQYLYHLTRRLLPTLPLDLVVNLAVSPLTISAL